MQSEHLLITLQGIFNAGFMPRPRKSRKIFRPPLISGYIPFGSSKGIAESIFLLYEEFEAMRLADYECLSQQEAADYMEVSRPTFSRIYDMARQKLAKALVEGLTLNIEGGNVIFNEPWYKCNACNTSFSSSKDEQPDNCPVCRSADFKELTKNTQQPGTDLLPRPAVYQTGFCVCPRCNLMVSHQAGVRCRSFVCPSCGNLMIREHHPVKN